MFCLFVCLCTRFVSRASGDQKRALDLLELELLAVMSHNMALGTKSWSSQKIISTFNQSHFSRPTDEFERRKVTVN